MPKTYRMKDKSDKYTVIKKDIFSLPFRVIACGKTGSGKSSIALGNFFLRDDFYKNDFLPENIYIFSGSLKGDLKLQTIIKELEIPEENTFDDFDEESAHVIYDMLVENFNEAHNNKLQPHHSVFIFDDLGYKNLQNKNKKNSILDKIFSNGRKYLISCMTLQQRMTQINSNAREQCSGLLLWKCTNRQLDLVEQDFNYLDNKKQFMNMIKDYTQGQHDFIVMDLGKDEIYRNKEFKPICLCKDGTNKCGGSTKQPN